MSFILIILAGILIGAFNVGFFILGYYLRGKKQEDAVEITEDNKEAIKELMNWIGYGGNQ